jgi:peptidoglycan hydrolase-like protein with peptidoglycan-binding domain
LPSCSGVRLCAPVPSVRSCAPLLVLAALAAAMLAPSPAAAAFGDRELRPGHRGHDVRVLQSWLTRLGHRTHVDGRYGTGTRRSVAGFRRAQRLKAVNLVSRPLAGRMRRMIESGQGNKSATSPPKAGEVAGTRARLSSDGRTALAPAEAPRAVKDAIAAANRITRKPYRYGGGHARHEDTGYDCSGAISYALRGARLMSGSMPSSGFMRWGQAGRGRWISVYAHGGHAYVIIAGLRFDTSGAGEKGPRWRTASRSSAGFTVRRPPGL